MAYFWDILSTAWELPQEDPKPKPAVLAIKDGDPEEPAGDKLEGREPEGPLPCDLFHYPLPSEMANLCDMSPERSQLECGKDQVLSPNMPALPVPPGGNHPLSAAAKKEQLEQRLYALRRGFDLTHVDKSLSMFR